MFSRFFLFFTRNFFSRQIWHLPKGVSAGYIQWLRYTVGCDDHGAPFLTIGTRYPVGASSARPRIRLIIAQEANSLPYSGNIMQTVYHKYVPVVIGLRANNVRPYGVDCTDRIDTVRRGRRTLRYPFSIKLKRRNIVNRHGNSPFSIFYSAQAKTGEHLTVFPCFV